MTFCCRRLTAPARTCSSRLPLCSRQAHKNVSRFELWWYALTLLVGRQPGHPACKNWAVGCWRGYLSGARCRLAYGPADGPAPLTVSCFSKIQSGFTFLVLAHPGCPGKRAVEWECVYVMLFDSICADITGTVHVHWAGRFQCQNISTYCQTALGNCYGLKLPKCWLQL